MLSLSSLEGYLLGLQVIVRGLQMINFILERLDFSRIDTIILQSFQYIRILSKTDLPWSAAEHYALATCETLLPDVSVGPL